VAAELGWDGSDVRIPSTTTIYDFLKANNFHTVKLAWKPLISGTNQGRRAVFGVEYKDMPEAFFNQILWSDETFIRARPTKQVMYYRTHKSIPYWKNPFNYQVHSGGFGVMFWGCFSSFAFGPLVVIKGSMDTDKYIKIIKKRVVPEMHAARDQLGVELIYMQDNAPCHKSKRSMAFMAKKHITPLNWPPQSPDLNPIENLWAIVKCRRMDEFGVPKTKEDLINQTFTIWEALDPGLAQTLARSVPRRLEVVVKSKGGSTKY
jgi:hypothetical protein